MFRDDVCIVRATKGKEVKIMNNVLELHIACPQCNYSNTATTSNAKYKEVVYQPCNDNEGQQDHNMNDQIKCDNCDNSFDFFWCAGHTIMENNAKSR
ncbi:MAG: hypothetical protein QOK69_07340 [Nitrososphaeraceae archaeon]|nr:hypothetical protein [Nitrososphaeraceae archaeon]